MVTPNRVEFKDDVKTNEIKLINKSDEITTYRISFKHLRMKMDGTYEEIVSGEPVGDEKFADDLIVYSPKQVTLKPGEVQTIRLMLKKPSNLPDGEYRSHMLLKEEAPADFGNNIEQKAGNDKKISVILKPLFAISIPVIVKNGELTSDLKISNLELKTTEKNHKLLAVTLDRSGNSGVYGDIYLTFTPNKSSTKYDIGSLNSIAVFSPYKNRNVLIDVNIPKNVKLSNGTIEASMYGKKDDGSNSTDKNRLLAQKSISIN